MRLRVEGMLLNARPGTHALRGEAMELDCVSGERVRVRGESWPSMSTAACLPEPCLHEPTCESFFKRGCLHETCPREPRAQEPCPRQLCPQELCLRELG